MDAKTLDALKASIAKWEKNARVKTYKAIRLGGDECPLCKVFARANGACDGCPVSTKTGHPGCLGTPYHRAVSNSYWWDSERERLAWVDAARAEVDFLKSLLPTEST